MGSISSVTLGFLGGILGSIVTTLIWSWLLKRRIRGVVVMMPPRPISPRSKDRSESPLVH